MSDESSRQTMRFQAPTGTDARIDTLRGLIPADWQPVEGDDVNAVEADLGTDLPRLRLEESDGTWTGALIFDDAGDRIETEECDSHNTAALHLRERLAGYGRALKERAERLLQISQASD